MPNLCVNTQKSEQGIYWIHDIRCSELSNTENIKSLGFHLNAVTAVAIARDRGYKPVEICTKCVEAT